MPAERSKGGGQAWRSTPMRRANQRIPAWLSLARVDAAVAWRI
jgi:hypothetical protein